MATPPAPVKLKTSRSTVSSFPSASRPKKQKGKEYQRLLAPVLQTNNTIIRENIELQRLHSFMLNCKWSGYATVPKTSLSLPGPLRTASVALY